MNEDKVILTIMDFLPVFHFVLGSKKWSTL